MPIQDLWKSTAPIVQKHGISTAPIVQKYGISTAPILQKYGISTAPIVQKYGISTAPIVRKYGTYSTVLLRIGIYIGLISFYALFSSPVFLELFCRCVYRVVCCLVLAELVQGMFVNIILHLAVAAVGWPQRNLASKTINYFRIAVKINLHQAALSEAKRKQIKKLTKHHLFYFWSENPSKISLHKLKLWELLQIFIGFNQFSLRYAVFANFVLTGTPSVLNTRIGTVPVLNFRSASIEAKFRVTLF